MQASNFFLLEQIKKFKLLNLYPIINVNPLMKIILKSINKKNQKAKIEKNKCTANSVITRKCLKVDL